MSHLLSTHLSGAKHLLPIFDARCEAFIVLQIALGHRLSLNILLIRDTMSSPLSEPFKVRWGIRNYASNPTIWSCRNQLDWQLITYAKIRHIRREKDWSEDNGNVGTTASVGSVPSWTTRFRILEKRNSNSYKRRWIGTIVDSALTYPKSCECAMAPIQPSLWSKFVSVGNIFCSQSIVL